jgi:hypothetical protein
MAEPFVRLATLTSRNRIVWSTSTACNLIFHSSLLSTAYERLRNITGGLFGSSPGRYSCITAQGTTQSRFEFTLVFELCSNFLSSDRLDTKPIISYIRIKPVMKTQINKYNIWGNTGIPHPATFRMKRSSTWLQNRYLSFELEYSMNFLESKD